MANHHFVTDYAKLVKDLLSKHPLDEAMSRAVGGQWATFGKLEAQILQHFGLAADMVVVDFGCGSGRLAHALPALFPIRYLGLDIVEELLAYARSKCPPSYVFKLHQDLSLPVKSNVANLVVAFSVFTHLQQAECFIYLREMARAIRDDGKIIFSFLEFEEPAHWPVFESTVLGKLTSTSPHLNAFIERSTINLWASKLDLEVEAFVGGSESVGTIPPLGQSLAVIRKNRSR